MTHFKATWVPVQLGFGKPGQVPEDEPALSDNEDRGATHF